MGDVVGNWHREDMLLTIFISDSVHVHRLEELSLVHKSLEWVGPAFSDGVEVVQLLEVFDIDEWELVVLLLLSCSWLLDERWGNSLELDVGT